MSEGTCSALSAQAGEPLAGTAGRTDTFLLLEARDAWERDVVASLADAPGDTIRPWLDANPHSKVLFIRRPRRRRGELAAFVVRAAAATPTIRRFRLGSYGDLSGVDLADGGEQVAGPLALVCGHGRRDACCARLGRPLYDALHDVLDSESLWLSSHQGGHRFAPNLLWLPDGLLFGRVDPAYAPGLLRDLAAGRLPLDCLRGRTSFPPEAQAAEIAVRAAAGIAGIHDIELISAASGHVRLGTPGGEVAAIVEVEVGPTVPASCGAVPEPVERYAVARIER